MNCNYKINKSEVLKYFCILQMNKNMMKISLKEWAKGILRESENKKKDGQLIYGKILTLPVKKCKPKH